MEPRKILIKFLTGFFHQALRTKPLMNKQSKFTNKKPDIESTPDMKATVYQDQGG